MPDDPIIGSCKIISLSTDARHQIGDRVARQSAAGGRAAGQRPPSPSSLVTYTDRSLAAYQCALPVLRSPTGHPLIESPDRPSPQSAQRDANIDQNERHIGSVETAHSSRSAKRVPELEP